MKVHVRLAHPIVGVVLASVLAFFSEGAVAEPVSDAAEIKTQLSYLGYQVSESNGMILATHDRLNGLMIAHDDETVSIATPIAVTSYAQEHECELLALLNRFNSASGGARWGYSSGGPVMAVITLLGAYDRKIFASAVESLRSDAARLILENKDEASMLLK